MQSTTSYSLTLSHKRTQTKTKQLHHYFSTFAHNTLCLHKISLYFLPFIILHFCSELPSSIATKLQIRSDRTALDFQQTDFNNFTGVCISTRYFCLNYHQFSFILPSSQQHRQQQQSIRPYSRIRSHALSSPTNTPSIFISFARFFLIYVRHIVISPHQQQFVVYSILHPVDCSNSVSRVPFPFINISSVVQQYFFILFYFASLRIIYIK